MSGRPISGSGGAVRWLVGAAVLCYALGYPLALGVGWAVGWMLVFLGGVFLIALGVVLVRRVHRSG